MSDLGVLGDLAGIHVDSGVSAKTGQPFLTVRATGQRASDGEKIVLVGQLDPAEVRTMALHWLEAAEAAETDAALLDHMTVDLGLPLEVVGQFVAALRARRDPR